MINRAVMFIVLVKGLVEYKTMMFSRAQAGPAHTGSILQHIDIKQEYKMSDFCNKLKILIINVYFVDILLDRRHGLNDC